MYRISTLGYPFDRKSFFMGIGDFIKLGWGSYNELIELSVRDLMEIKVGIESRMQEEQLQNALK